MSMTYEELHRKTVAELREIAKGLDHEAVHGYTQMNKDHLLPAICRALGIDTHTHHHLESGFDKAKIKARMRELRRQRENAVHDRRLAPASRASSRMARAESSDTRTHGVTRDDPPALATRTGV
jgi:hypothetical protein